jgi:hypothetical protein
LYLETRTWANPSSPSSVLQMTPHSGITLDTVTLLNTFPIGIASSRVVVEPARVGLDNAKICGRTDKANFRGLCARLSYIILARICGVSATATQYTKVEVSHLLSDLILFVNVLYT